MLSELPGSPKMTTMEGKMKTQVKKSLADLSLGALAATVLALGILAGQAEQAEKKERSQQAEATEVQVSPLKVVLYEGKDCLQDSGEIEAVVLTNDDADWRLQHCSGGVAWKELRRE
jgi:hypothetical protein